MDLKEQRTVGIKRYAISANLQDEISKSLSQSHGSCKDSTKVMHEGRFTQLVKFSGVSELKNIDQIHLDHHCLYLNEQVLEETMSRAYASNCLLSNRLVLERTGPNEFVFPENDTFLDKKDVSPIPVHFQDEVLEGLVSKLEEIGEYDLAIVLLLARFFGLTLRESVLFRIDEAIKSYKRGRFIKITRGRTTHNCTNKCVSPTLEVFEKIVFLYESLRCNSLHQLDNDLLGYSANLHGRVSPLLIKFGYSTLRNLRLSYFVEWTSSRLYNDVCGGWLTPTSRCSVAPFSYIEVISTNSASIVKFEN